MQQGKAQSYTQLLEEIRLSSPLIASLLYDAQEMRMARVRRYSSSIRFEGLNDLFRHLLDINQMFAQATYLNKFTFLIQRAIGDFEASVEGLVSGIPSVVWDKMRDVMEVEYLFRDFVYFPIHAEVWLKSGERDRRAQFSPSALRDGLAKHLGIHPNDLTGTADYHAHSKVMHVNQLPVLFNMKGFTRYQRAADVEDLFVDIFAHGERLVLITDELMNRFQVADQSLVPGTALPKLSAALEFGRNAADGFRRIERAIEESFSRQEQKKASVLENGLVLLMDTKTQSMDVYHFSKSISIDDLLSQIRQHGSYPIELVELERTR